jgi:hypothetical protein
MAEESTVGGVTVQHLAEVERTITDPTLTSTYEKLFKEAKYRKTRFIIPYTLEDDDINPPKQNTSGQFEVNFDGFTASAPLPKKLEAKIKVLTQSIVRARAN